MKTYEATEAAYKNGYKKGYEDGFKDGYDGGVWKLEATRNVAAYFEEKLQDLIEKGFVVVIR